MELTINGTKREVDVPSDMPVLWVLRDVLCMTGNETPPIEAKLPLQPGLMP